VTPPDAEIDPSVCYRHPDRSSWTLCERCGRTICAECQILTPAGVRCPDCVRETGGSVRWEPAAGGKPRAKKAGMRGTRSSAVAARVSNSSYPVATITIAAAALLLWIGGFVTANLPYSVLAALPEFSWQPWRYVTAAFAYFASGPGAIFTVLSIGIFVYISWNAEKQFGRSRYLGLFFVSGAGAAALSLLVGAGTSGLIGPIWGIAGAYIILVWPQPAARNQMLISLVIWFVITLVLGGNLLALIGGVGAGIGTMLLLRVYDDRPRSRPSTPYLIVAAGIAVIAVLAVLRNTVLT
jgi:membrane associated rhomboid family serine protease